MTDESRLGRSSEADGTRFAAGSAGPQTSETARIELVIGEGSTLMGSQDSDSLAKREELHRLRDYLVEQLSVLSRNAE